MPQNIRIGVHERHRVGDQGLVMIENNLLNRPATI